MQIPLYQQQINVGGGLPAPRADTNPVSGAIGQGLTNAAQGLQQVGQALAHEEIVGAKLLHEQEEQDAKAWAGNALSNAQLQWQQNMKERQEAATGGAPGFTLQLIGDFDKYTQQTLQSAPTPQAKQYLQQHLTALRTQLVGQAISFEAGARVADRVNTTSDSITKQASLVFADPSKADSAVRVIEETMPEVGPEMRTKLLAKAKSEIYYAAAASIARSNPDAIVGPPGLGANAATGGQYAGGFSGADAFIAQKEGGYTANDNGRGPTNFGINSQANPDVDVSKLTPEQASQIRKTRYWDAIHADALPPSMQPVAYNFAIQAGAGAANKLLREAGGDAAKFNDMAKSYYADIAKGDAKQASNVPMWQKRSDEAFKMGSASSTPADNPVLANLPFETRIQVFNQAKTQQSQNMAMARAQLDTHLQDAQSMAVDGKTDPTPLNLDDLVRAYGPLEAPARYRQYQDGQQMALDVANLKGMPSQDIADMVRSRAPTAGPGYASADRDHQILQAAASRVIQQRESDPAAYAVANAPAVNTAQQALQANPSPQTAQAYAQASLAEQRRLGVSKPQVLTKQQAESITGQINANGGAQADQVIQQQAQLWGDRWGDVFGQLKDITPVAKVLGYLGNSVDTATRQQVLAAANTKMEALKDGLDPPNIKAAESKLQALSQPFAATMAYSLGGASTFGALYDSANRLSLTYMRQGMSPGDAATKAFTSVMGNQFTIRDTARIPKEFDADQVMTSARTIMGDLNKLDLTLPPAPKTMKPEDAKALYASNLRSNGKWITSADGKGLVLFDPVSQTIVTTQDGKPVGGQFSTMGAKPVAAAPVKPTPTTPTGREAFAQMTNEAAQSARPEIF